MGLEGIGPRPPAGARPTRLSTRALRGGSGGSGPTPSQAPEFAPGVEAAVWTAAHPNLVTRPAIRDSAGGGGEEGDEGQAATGEHGHATPGSLQDAKRLLRQEDGVVRAGAEALNAGGGVGASGGVSASGSGASDLKPRSRQGGGATGGKAKPASDHALRTVVAGDDGFVGARPLVGYNGKEATHDGFVAVPSVARNDDQRGQRGPAGSTEREGEASVTERPSLPASAAAAEREQRGSDGSTERHHRGSVGSVGMSLGEDGRMAAFSEIASQDETETDTSDEESGRAGLKRAVYELRDRVAMVEAKERQGPNFFMLSR